MRVRLQISRPLFLLQTFECVLDRHMSASQFSKRFFDKRAFFGLWGKIIPPFASVFCFRIPMEPTKRPNTAQQAHHHV